MKPHTLRQAFQYNITQVGPSLSRSSRAHIEDTFRKIQAYGIETLPLSELTGAVVREFLASLSSLKVNTRHNHYVMLKTVVARYIRDNSLNIKVNIDGIMKNPLRLMEPKPYLTFAELKNLGQVNFKSASLRRGRDFFLIMAMTGMAISDLLRFTPKWISPDGQWIYYYRTKNNNRCEVPMVFPSLRELIAEHYWPLKWSVRTVQSSITELSHTIGKRVTAHSARHSFGVVMLEMGFSMESVSKMMGHTSIATTERIYAKITQEKITREMATIPQHVREQLKINNGGTH